MVGDRDLCYVFFDKRNPNVQRIIQQSGKGAGLKTMNQTYFFSCLVLDTWPFSFVLFLWPLKTVRHEGGFGECFLKKEMSSSLFVVPAR